MIQNMSSIGCTRLMKTYLKWPLSWCVHKFLAIMYFMKMNFVCLMLMVEGTCNCQKYCTNLNILLHKARELLKQQNFQILKSSMSQNTWMPSLSSAVHKWFLQGRSVDRQTCQHFIKVSGCTPKLLFIMVNHQNINV